MSGVTSQYARILRRETHSPRSGPAITVAVVLILACVYAGIEIVLGLLGQAPLLVAPTDALQTLSGLADAPAGVVVIVGVIAAVIGLLLVLQAITPGRRAKHQRTTDRSAVVVDNEVIASSIARHVSYAAGVGPDNVRVGVTHRAATAEITPASGVPVDTSGAKQVIREQVESYGLSPSLSPRVSIAKQGKVGA